MNIKEREFQWLSNFIRMNIGINIKKEKTALLEGRLYNYLIKNNFGSYKEYCDYLKNDKTGQAVSGLIDRITTNHTFFMREEQHFIYMSKMVLPFIESNSEDNDLRIWCAGCSTGEEAYLLQMIISDYFKNSNMWDTTMLATDISSRVLKIANKGIYPKESIEKIPDKYRKLFMEKYDGSLYKVCDLIKDKIIFRKFNLINRQFSFKKRFQVIFCRNVMIYFNNETKKILINKFYDFTEPGGYLFIGQSESLLGCKTGYKYIKPGIYRKDIT